MLGMFQLIDHSSRIVFYSNMADTHDIHNHIIIAQTVTSGAYSWSQICCRRENYPVNLFLLHQEIQIKLSQCFYAR